MNAVKNGSNSQVAERINPTASKPTPKKPRKQATKPESAMPATTPAAMPAEPVTTAQRIDALGKLDHDDLKLFGDLVTKLEAGEPVEQAKAWYEAAQAAQKPAPEPMPTETTDPFDSDHLTFSEPETYLQPVGTLARYALAHLIIGEFGERLFGNDYLDADGFEALHGLYIDLRNGIAHGFPHMNLEDVKPAILACESKSYL